MGHRDELPHAAQLASSADAHVRCHPCFRARKALLRGLRSKGETRYHDRESADCGGLLDATPYFHPTEWAGAADDEGYGDL